MSTLPRVTPLTRERVAREFDDRGPEVCRTEIALDLEANNPEILDMATRCARDVGEFTRVMTGFCMFYRLLTHEARAAARVRLVLQHRRPAMFYVSHGDIPPKRHTQHRAPDGSLYAEELFGVEGFAQQQ